MSSFDPQLVHARNERLLEVAGALKRDFVGIDGVIDELIDALRVWYLMPEALTRPIIINLWGMTGVGKTDLVRRLVKGLDFQDRFMEIEMNAKDRFGRNMLVTTLLDNNGLNDGNPKILLFDELQRFRSVDKKGEPVRENGFVDFWELLSDGRLSQRERSDLEITLAEMIIARRDRERGRKDGDSEDGSTVSLYDAQRLKQTLQMEEELPDIVGMPDVELIERVQTAMRKKRIFEPVDHSKTLILVSGNLDEAFTMAGMTSESDVDADIFHAFTEKVTLVDVKQALSERFLPEQVSRLGNIHLIYSSLRRRDFEELIRREITRIRETTARLFAVDVEVSPAIESLIYRNGVFPTQGTRPVFSSVADILESRLSRLILDARLEGSDSLTIDYDENTREIVASFSGGRVHRAAYVGRLDRARERRTKDLLANVAVHEAGHAVAYIVQFGLAPLQLTARVSFAGAMPAIHPTKKN